MNSFVLILNCVAAFTCVLLGGVFGLWIAPHVEAMAMQFVH